ncbi:MFS transporter, partial [Balneolaceae bacterium ANBcel3]|nr:MFS transporter [Balneolaceae bacterium ANBcel3]
MLTFGIVMTVLGSSLPSIIEKFGLSRGAAGSLFVFMTIGMFFSSLLFGPIVDRFGYKPVLITSSFLVILGIQSVAHAPSLLLLKAALFLCGFGGAALNGGTNALVSDISDGKRGSMLTLLGVFYGVGAFGVPLFIGSLLDSFQYEWLVSVVGATIFLPFVVFFFVRFPVPKHEKGFPLAEGLKVAKDKALIVFGLILMLQGGMEMAMGGWSATWFQEVLDIRPGTSVIFLSFFWFSLMSSRILLGYLLLKIPATRILRTSYLLSFTGTLLMLFSTTPSAGLIGLLLTGMGFAAIFPVILAFIGDLFYKLSGTAFSIVMVMSLTGALSMPLIIG